MLDDHGLFGVTLVAWLVFRFRGQKTRRYDLREKEREGRFPPFGRERLGVMNVPIARGYVYSGRAANRPKNVT